MLSEFEIQREVEIEPAPEQSWQAIATGPGITSWLMPHEVTPGAGGTVRRTVAGFEYDAAVTEWEPGKPLAYRAPAAPDGSVPAMEFLIEGRDGSATVVRFVPNGFTGDGWGDEYGPGFAHGWELYLHTLREYLLHFAGRPVTYIGATGPATSVDRDNWPALKAGLGIDGPSAVGGLIRLTPAGLSPLTGVVDYLTDAFLGVRTAAGRYRFHGVHGLGTVLAVGHRLYRDDVDRAAVERDWTSWLAVTSAG